MISRLLIANRGEVAVRVIRTASEMSISTVAIYSEDDAQGLHVTMADAAEPLRGAGAAAYLDIEFIAGIAKQRGCDAVHPGWGFLSENAELAARLEREGIRFVGPDPATLRALGDKVTARRIAAAAGIPTLPGSSSAVTLEDAKEFLRQLGPGASMFIKAVAGGGGRGIRAVSSLDEVESAYTRCQSEALRAFGDGAVYVEQRLVRARHVEVQVVGDGTGEVSHLWERDCSLQRRHQKMVEIAPAPGLSADMRERLTADAVHMASGLNYSGVGTFEFLVQSDAGKYAFIEANPRLQVEHTITEEIVGVDLVRVQLEIAGGARLGDLGLLQPDIPSPRGWAMQLRVNSEEILPNGGLRPSAGVLSVFKPPSGPGVRTDTAGYEGYTTSPSFDSLLAKLIVHAPTGGFEAAVARGLRALREFRLAGVASNIGFLRNLLEHPEFRAAQFYTTFVDEHLPELASAAEDIDPLSPQPGQLSGHTAGARVDNNDPLAVLVYGKTQRPSAVATTKATGLEQSPGAVLAPMQATVVSFEVNVGDLVRKGQEVAVLNAMKMEHVLKAPVGGSVVRFNAAPGDTISAGQLLILIQEDASAGDHETGDDFGDLDEIRPDLAAVLARHARALDAARPGAVARRHESGHRTTRENIADLVDPDSFVEWGSLVIGADSRFTTEQLIDKSPADGMIIGVASVNGDSFLEPTSQVVIIAYDYMVFAGTQGGRNHAKTDKAIDIAQHGRIPVVLFAEGGGGRAGGGDGGPPRAGGPGTVTTFRNFARLSGLVPLIGIVSGRCFAGNASLLGMCDVIIATRDSNIGMGGPAMIEGGGLGVFAPEDIGPIDVQTANGVVDVAVEDEAEAIRAGKQYLSYFQGRLSTWECADQRRLRHIIPENRLRVYSIHQIIETLADTGSVLELRKHFGTTMVTAFIRVEGRPVGVIANNPMDTGGAVTSDGADKACRFMQICDAFDIPILFLNDTPGIMVGPEVEKTAIVRHANRLFTVGCNLSVPTMNIVLRKGYGLGTIGMSGGDYRAPFFTVAWPTGEFGGMGLEGQVKLGFRNELAAIDNPEERRQRYEQLVARAYERGKALNEASNFGIDETIDPQDSRRWITAVLKSYRWEPRPPGKKRPCVDGW